MTQARNALAGAVLALLLAPGGGCVLLVGAAAGAAAVYVTGEDQAEVYFDERLDIVFGAARAELEQRGQVTSADLAQGYLDGHADGAHVQIWVTMLGPDTRKCLVQARSNLDVSPAPDTARAIAQAIAARLD